jgi:probable HAF family extracellular repeat protein
MTMIRKSLATIVAAAAWCNLAHAQMTFAPLGDLPGGSLFSRAFGVSADGLVVVRGSTSASGDVAYRWTSGGGMVGLGCQYWSWTR